MGYHLIDQLLWWFGAPEKVHAQISALAVPGSSYDAEDSATISFRYANGLHGTLLISRAAGEKREGYEVYGSKGYLVGSKKSFVVSDRQGENMNEMRQSDTEEMMDRQLDFFLSRVRNNQGFADIQKNHMLNMEFIDRCYRDAVPEGSQEGINKSTTTLHLQTTSANTLA
jgi:predicted dehydrogenase